jgi:DNA-binding transcriptional LysR family regulator
LRAFEAFSRHGRMALAADELCVTHGAVSRHVRQLEAALGVALVEGPKTALRLTEPGARLAASLTSALDQVAGAIAIARAEAPQTLEVSCLGTLAMRWLIPRLPRFVERQPNVQVGLTESHAHVDFRRDGVDLAIRMSGEIVDDEVEKTPFLDHYVGPLLSPALMGDGPVTLERLAALPRLHTRTFRRGWTQWQAATGHRLGPAPVDREFDHNFYMLEAAAAGLGVAMGSWAFVLDEMVAGKLVAPLGFIRAQVQVVALRPRGVANPAAEAFRDWLVEEGAATPAPPVPPIVPPAPGP